MVVCTNVTHECKILLEGGPAPKIRSSLLSLLSMCLSVSFSLV